MDIEGIVEYLERRIEFGCYFFPADKDVLLEIVKHLKKEDVYKKMWFELCDVFNHSSGMELMHMNSEDFRNHINKIRDKYLEG